MGIFRKGFNKTKAMKDRDKQAKKAKKRGIARERARKKNT